MQVDTMQQSQSPAEHVAWWLARYEHNRSTAIEWLDRSWLPSWLADESVPYAALATPDCIEALMRAVSLPALDTSAVLDRSAQGVHGAFGACHVRCSARLASLPVPDQLRVLRLRSLYFRRGEVRRVVDLQRRSRLAASLGNDGAAQLRWLQSLPDAPEMPALARTIGAPTLESLDEAALAWEGYCLLERDGIVVPSEPNAAMLRRALPRAFAEPAWLARCAREIDANGGEIVANRLPIMFPECAWSFGCETLTSS